MLPYFALTEDDRHALVGTYVYNSWRGKIYECALDNATPPRLIATNIHVSGPQVWSQSPDRRRLVAMNADREVVTLDVASGKQMASFPVGPRQSERTDWGGNLALSPDESKIAVTENSARDVEIYEAKSGRLLYALPGPSGLVTWLAWSPDSARLAVAHSTGEVSVWNLGEVSSTLAKLDLSP